MLNDAIISRLYDEEAEKLEIALGPRYAVDRPSIHSGVSEATARSIISTWLRQQSGPSLVEKLIAENQRHHHVMNDPAASQQEKDASEKQNVQANADALRRK